MLTNCYVYCKGTTKTAGWMINLSVKTLSSTSISTPTGLYQPFMDQDMEWLQDDVELHLFIPAPPSQLQALFQSPILPQVWRRLPGNNWCLSMWCWCVGRPATWVPGWGTSQRIQYPVSRKPGLLTSQRTMQQIVRRLHCQIWFWICFYLWWEHFIIESRRGFTRVGKWLSFLMSTKPIPAM